MALLHLEPLPPRTSKGDLLALLQTQGGLRRDRVGKIDLRGSTAAVEVPDDWVARLVRSLDGATLKDRKLRAWSLASRPSDAGDEDHLRRLARLLELESEGEARQRLEEANRGADAGRRGECLGRLVVAGEDSGLGGRCLLTLALRDRSQPLPWNRFEPGTPALLAPEGGADTGWRGVVCERTSHTVCLALNEPPEDADRGGTFRLYRSADEVARHRQGAALERVRTASGDRLAELRAVLLGDRAPAFGVETPLSPLDGSLNDSQRRAVSFALSARDVAILHGPPGTGKTTTVVELIRQAVARGERVLACAPSNLGVDNLLERLLAHGVDAVRLGHPARVLPALRAHTLDLLVLDHPETRQARKWAREAFALFRQAGKHTRARPEPGARQSMRQEARGLLADARRAEAEAVEAVLRGAAVVCATLTGLDSEVLGQRSFDLAVVDEAAQATEPACWLPLLRSRRAVLAGDHRQLPPTIVSAEADRGGLGVSLMERLDGRYGASITRRLDVQYRMHEAIMTFPSIQLYDGSLVAHPSVRHHVLADLPGVRAEPATLAPVRFIDTAGAGYDEQVESDGASRLNPQEADLVRRRVAALLDAGVPADGIGVIAPYAAHVRLLREKLAVAGLEIDSVDGFQGREKEALVVSMVRSNVEGEVGFLADVRRMNVALTRARRHLLVIGDSATLSCHPFYEALLEYFEAIGARSSVWEEE